MTRDLATVTQDAHGRFYEAVYRGNVYTAATASAGYTIVATTDISPLPANTGVPIIGIFNPTVSTVNLVVMRTKLVTISGTPAGPISWNVIPAPCGITIAGTQGLNNKTFQVGGIGRVALNTAITGSAAGIMFRSLGGPGPGAVAGTLMQVEEITDGDIIVAPGAFAGLAAFGTGTSQVVLASITWEEVAV
jgi:hypothetical protein